MKRYIPYIALLALVATVGCSADSPRANPAPTVVPEAWSVISLDASNTAPFVGTVILVEATVTLNGSPAPDDTAITFEASGGAFGNGTTTASVLSEGGTASVAFISQTEGTYTIRARVRSASREVAVQYQDRAATDALQLTSVDPRRGSYAGGDQVVITGKGIQTPVDVFFDLDGFAYQAILVGVTPSDPLSADGTITVITPAFTGTNTGIQQTADVRVNTNAGTGSQETDTLPDAFVLLPGGGPQIYGVSPSSGRSSGGEVVNVLGQGFGSVASDLSVSFSDPAGVVRLGTVLAVSPDGTQIQVETPRFSTIPLEADEPQDVTVATLDGVVKLEAAFIVLADEPTPSIASISPIAGPLDGGTLVTIFGGGFQVPVQVKFGNLTALDVNVFNDTTPADNDRITCVTPDYSQQGDVSPVNVDVVVTNMTSGKEASYNSFTYGDRLYITGNTPTEGGLGDLVIIYGSGFEDPLQVFLGDELMELVSVSGTELVIRIPDEFADQCDGSSGAFKVVLLESNQETEGGNFTIRGNSPIVLSVSPVFFQEATIAGQSLSIFGQDFAADVAVQLGSYTVPSGNLGSISQTSIEVNNLPTYDFILPNGFDQEACTLGGGSTGVRNMTTPVDVTVTNFPGNCPDQITGAFAIEPATTACVIAPEIDIDFNPAFPDIISGNCSQQALTIFNLSAGSTLTGTVRLDNSSDFYFSPSAGTGDKTAKPFTIGPADPPFNLTVYFCPSAADSEDYVGTLTVESNDPDELFTPYNLTGTEGSTIPSLAVAPLALDFGQLAVGDPADTLNVDVTNNGSQDLNWTATLSGTCTEFSAAPLAGGPLVEGGPADTITVTFTPAVAPGVHDACSLVVTATETDAVPKTFTVTLSAETIAAGP